MFVSEFSPSLLVAVQCLVEVEETKLSFLLHAFSNFLARELTYCAVVSNGMYASTSRLCRSGQQSPTCAVLRGIPFYPGVCSCSQVEVRSDAVLRAMWPHPCRNSECCRICVRFYSFRFVKWIVLTNGVVSCYDCVVSVVGG